jgi:hypothetical protein
MHITSAHSLATLPTDFGPRPPHASDAPITAVTPPNPLRSRHEELRPLPVARAVEGKLLARRVCFPELDADCVAHTYAEAGTVEVIPRTLHPTVAAYLADGATGSPLDTPLGRLIDEYV